MVDVELRIYANEPDTVLCLKERVYSDVLDGRYVLLKYSGSSGGYEVFNMILRDVDNPCLVGKFIQTAGAVLDPLGEKLLECPLAGKVSVYIRAIRDCFAFWSAFSRLEDMGVGAFLWLCGGV
ncbi:hypothetical protein [Thermococcus sp.]